MRCHLIKNIFEELSLSVSFWEIQNSFHFPFVCWLKKKKPTPFPPPAKNKPQTPHASFWCCCSLMLKWQVDKYSTLSSFFSSHSPTWSYKIIPYNWPPTLWLFTVEYNPTSTHPALKMIIVIFWYSLMVTVAPYFNISCKFHCYILIFLVAGKI